jgi:Tol biopolymer transport system component
MASLTVGSRIGVYEIGALLGVGGMGEVYRARDTGLGRDVAIKVLSSSLAADPDRLARFGREAQLLASLNHPHIAQIYGLEGRDGQSAPPFIVMELVDGETLAERIAKRPIALAEALAFARQIAEALDAAHERGIVHRDLKPANIAITADGVVKVLDFGLAKGADGAGGSPRSGGSDYGLTHSPTVMAPTIDGVLLGTAPYMSPEQARGRAVDKRTDIWAFGCVLYEMLTGRRAFVGETITDVLAKIVERDPDWTALSAAAPAEMVRLVRRCLQKDPKSRLRDIGDIRDELNQTSAAGDSAQGTRAEPESRPSREYVAWALAVVAMLALAVVLVSRRGLGTPAAASVTRTQVVLPGDLKLSSTDTAYPLALTADGTRLAFVAERDGRSELFIRDMSALEPKAISGATGAMHPFFSPDGQWVGFFAGGALQKVAIAGGAPIRICNVSSVPLGAAWGADNTIVFALRRSGLWTVAAAGGDAKEIAGSTPAAWPQILPDGRTVLFATGVGLNISAIATVPLSGGEKHIVGRTNESSVRGPAGLGTGDIAQPRFVSTGYLLYGQSPGSLKAASFDLATGTLTGSAVSMVDSIERGRAGGGVYFAVSKTGLLVYAGAGDHHQLVWVDRGGTATPISGDRLAFRHPRVSPDGKRIAVAINDERTRRSDIWIYDAETGAKSRLTSDHHNLRPVWTPDGASVTFSGGGIVNVAADGGRGRDVLIDLMGAYPSSWLSDHRALLIDQDDGAGHKQLLFSKGENRQPLPSLFNGRQGQFSPDGHWIVYSSDESGRDEIYARSYPALGGNTAISTDGGVEARWARDGRELFFRQGDALMAVTVDTTKGFRAEKPRRLFAGQYSGAGREIGFDVSLDGRRFVMVKSDEASTLRQLTVVQNWLEEVRARVSPTK